MGWLSKSVKSFFLRYLLFWIRRYDDLVVFFHFLKPSVHLSRLRIKEVNDKQNINANDPVCIFVIYERMEIPLHTIETLLSIKKMGIKLFVVVNSILSEQSKSEVKNIADISMFRNNTGKDIGAYKDCYLYLHEKDYLRNVSKVIFANDSVIYPKAHVKDLFGSLLYKKQSFVGYSHVQEIHYHIQSFLFSCDNKLLNDKIFFDFWKKYIPVGRRRYMIRNGEVGLSKMVIKSGKTIAVLNDLSDIITKIETNEISILDASEIIYSLPTKYLSQLGILDDFDNMVKSYSNRVSANVRHIKIDSTSELIDEIKKDVTLEKSYLFRRFIFSVFLEISKHNNTAWNTFVFLKYGKKVVIKRDSLLRAGYDYDVFKYNINKYFDENEAEAILAMVKSPASSHLKGIRKVMFDYGII